MTRTDGWCWALGVVCWGLGGGGCAPAGSGARPPPLAEIVQRGVMVVDRRLAPSAVIDGPALVHVYAESGGGTVYLVPGRARAGGAGCEGRGGGPAPVEVAIPPARRLTVVVRDGETACMKSHSRRPLEVMWHAHRASPWAPEFRAPSSSLAKQP